MFVVYSNTLFLHFCKILALNPFPSQRGFERPTPGHSHSWTIVACRGRYAGAPVETGKGRTVGAQLLLGGSVWLLNPRTPRKEGGREKGYPQLRAQFHAIRRRGGGGGRRPGHLEVPPQCQRSNFQGHSKAEITRFMQLTIPVPPSKRDS